VDGAAEGICYDSTPDRRVLAVAILGSAITFLDSTIVNLALLAIGCDRNAAP
jgi:hypothetical protein